ncbi:hypothetical protein RD149_11990 [Gordonia westfalica]|uniref:Uncharacterized protein n=1 Tax=Gordonia westfalica TaxID=158898 RepID=A0ABU2GSP1_9ACTN|nr:hypothetical protein [Gordonia westfalica]MDS1114486.1 hypothetical protein [Gordonia westfalica]
MDDKQFEMLMDRLKRISGYLETLVIEGRENHHALIQQLESIDAGVMLPDDAK